MFITKPEFQQHVPEALRFTEDSMYWGAFFLSTEGHWYLLSYRIDSENLVQTLGVAHVEELVNILEVLGPESIVGLCRLSATRTPGHWCAQDVQEVWVPPAWHAEAEEAVLLRLRGEERLRSAYMDLVNHDLQGWIRLAHT